MSTKKFYNGYKKMRTSKLKFKDETVPKRIENILKYPIIFGNTKKFLESVYEQYDKNGELSEAQLNAVKKIENKYSKETLEDYEKWKSNYDKEKKEIATLCALYYKINPPYFAELAQNILDDENFIPTQRQYDGMCNNKYTKKVVEQTKAEPKFSVGQLLRGRKTAPLTIRDKYFSVIEIGAKPITSAALGAKIYTLLPLGKTQVAYCEERFLKKVKK
tara:strand:+ start:2143 stop:2796 length:654 start_codon:yes stop_codon:yes gene_type:complete